MKQIQAKGILSAKNGMNVYRGCTHGCIYCDARSLCYHTPIPFEVVEKEFEAKIAEIGDCERYPRKICPICPFVKRCVHQDLRIGKIKPLNEQE